MNIASVLFVVFLLSPTLCCAYGEPFVMGEGHFLSANEKKEFFQKLEKSAQTVEKEKYDNEYEKYVVYAGNPKKIDVLQFSRFNAVVSTELYKGARSGYEIFMICFGCKEGIPAGKRVAGEKSNARFYDIWVLSGYFIILEKHPKTEVWRVLSSGGAE